VLGAWYTELLLQCLCATVADITAARHPEGTAPQQWLHIYGWISILRITGAMAVYRLCTAEHPVWAAHGQEPVQTSGQGLCTGTGLPAAAPR
jgi:hypothetical protein